MILFEAFWEYPNRKMEGEPSSTPYIFIKRIGRRCLQSNNDEKSFKYKNVRYVSLIDVNFEELRAELRKDIDFSLAETQCDAERSEQFLALYFKQTEYEPKSLVSRYRLLSWFFDLHDKKLDVPTNEDLRRDISASEHSKFTEFLFKLLREHHINDVIGENVPEVIEHETLKPTLRPYQFRAVRWLIHRERNEATVPHNYVKIFCHDQPDLDFYLNRFTLQLIVGQPESVRLPSGGILADEMGLGKTVEMLCLILLNRNQKICTPKSNVEPECSPAKRQKVTEMLYCICVNTESMKETIQCSVCKTLQHVACVRKFSETHHEEMNYICPKCWENRPLVASGATIIVSPQTIKMQWYAEICKHTTEPPKILVYNGIHSGGWISPEELSEYDIVLTDYDVLTREIHCVHTNDINLRHSQKYMRMPSPLIRVNWWRVCLDEAQLVESSMTNSSRMVKILPTVHRWAVTGTPIQKSMRDLQGLLEFLNVVPFYLDKYFLSLITSFRKNEIEPLVATVGAIMWRTCKSAVVEELGIPEQTEKVHYVALSDAERLFYQQQHTACSEAFNEKSEKYFSSSDSIAKMNPKMLKIILEPLKKLRQDCSVPFLFQKGEQSIAKKFLKPKQLVEHLKSTNETESKTELRTIVSHINGIASIHCARGEFDLAIQQYKSVLRLAKEYTGTISVDTLLQIHALHNLVQALQALPGDAENEAQIKEYSEQCSKLEWKYIENYQKTAEKRETNLKSFTESVAYIRQKFHAKYEGQWFSNILYRIQNAKYENLLLNKINEECSVLMSGENRFETIEALNYTVISWLDKLKDAREKVLDCCTRIREFLRYVKPNKDLTLEETEKLKDLIRNVYDCHLYEELNPKKGKKSGRKTSKTEVCDLCHAHRKTVDYECVIFNVVFVKTNDNVSGDWNPTMQETVIKITHSIAKAKGIHRGDVHEGELFLQLLEAMKKEFKELRQFWVELEYIIKAYDELNMCKLRMEVVHAGAIENDSNFINKLVYEDMDKTLQNFQYLLRSAELSFVRKMARLRYINHLENEYNPGICPICQTDAPEEYAVLQCGHHICKFCVRECRKFNRINLTCSVCRNQQKYADLYYVIRDAEDRERYKHVKGDHSSKIFEIIRIIKSLLVEDSSVKIIIFSQWDSVLSVIADALVENNVKCVHKMNQRKNGIEQFKDLNAGITCLLMPLARGAQGLNLTEATHVFLVEPILNPGEELQAIGRIHRIGQTKPTTVHRFIVKNSVEETIFNTIRNDNTGKWANRDITIENLTVLFSTNDEGPR